jgi:hypothetical protein
MIGKAIRGAKQFWFRSLREYGNENRILIYQMGKVGSTSLSRALGDRAIQIHNFYPNNEPWAQRPHYRLGLARRLGHGLFYRAIRRGARRRRSLKIITLVRDPIARNISMYFEDLHYRLAYYFTEVKPNVSRRADIDVLSDCFKETFGHRYPLEWFDREFKRLTGVDVYEHAFDRKTGYAKIEEGPTSVLILQVERLKDNWSVVEEFCGLRLPWREDNLAARKWYAAPYSEFVSKFSMSANELDEIYSSRYATFFYSEEALAAFRRRWQAKEAVMAPPLVATMES